MVVARLALVIATVLVLIPAGHAAHPPRDRLPPTKLTVDGPADTGDLRPVFQFGARDNRTV
jgi:hypothetical protein